MGLFDKKFCDICGSKIGMLGNRKLEDGNCCKDCAKKLSPWFDERRHSTVAQIKEQLACREENKQAVAAFHTTRSFGESYKLLYIDERARKFLVAGSGSFKDENPDVVDFSRVTAVNLDVRESRRELKQKDAQGKEISFDPPRYEHEYDFYLVIRVNHPWFDEMRFKLNSNQLVIQELGAVKRGFMITQTAFDPRMSYEYQNYEKMAEEITHILQSRCGQNMGMAGDMQLAQSALPLIIQAFEAEKAKDVDRAAMLYKQAIQMGAIKEGYTNLLVLLLNKTKDGTERDCQELIDCANQAKKDGYDGAQADRMIQLAQMRSQLLLQDGGPWTCPGCGASNSGKFCENCGSPKP